MFCKNPMPFIFNKILLQIRKNIGDIDVNNDVPSRLLGNYPIDRVRASFCVGIRHAEKSVGEFIRKLNMCVVDGVRSIVSGRKLKSAVLYDLYNKNNMPKKYEPDDLNCMPGFVFIVEGRAQTSPRQYWVTEITFFCFPFMRRIMWPGFNKSHFKKEEFESANFDDDTDFDGLIKSVMGRVLSTTDITLRVPNEVLFINLGKSIVETIDHNGVCRLFDVNGKKLGHLSPFSPMISVDIFSKYRDFVTENTYTHYFANMNDIHSKFINLKAQLYRNAFNKHSDEYSNRLTRLVLDGYSKITSSIIPGKAVKPLHVVILLSDENEFQIVFETCTVHSTLLCCDIKVLNDNIVMQPYNPNQSISNGHWSNGCTEEENKKLSRIIQKYVFIKLKQPEALSILFDLIKTLNDDIYKNKRFVRVKSNLVEMNAKYQSKISIKKYIKMVTHNLGRNKKSLFDYVTKLNFLLDTRLVLQKVGDINCT